MAAVMAQYKQLLYEKRRDASQATLDAFFSKASLPEASASDEAPTSDEPPPASNEPQPSTSKGGFTCVTLSSSSSDIDDPGVV